MSCDLKLISGNYLDQSLLSKEVGYLAKYFQSDVQLDFLMYYYHFKDLCDKFGPTYFFEAFRGNTGHIIEDKVLYQYRSKYYKLVQFVEKCKSEGNLEVLASVRNGTFVLKNLKD